MSSDESQSAPSFLFSSETVRDIMLWKRKRLSILLLTVATTIWMLFDIYDFNFVTVFSWIALLALTSLFIYANLVRLFRKEEPSISRFEIGEESMVEIGKRAREMVEEGIRWMFHVSVEEDWIEFVRVMMVLLVLSYVGNFIDLLSFLYIGMVIGMSVPVMYKKNEEKIKRSREWVNKEWRRLCEMVKHKVMKKSKQHHHEVKEKKVE